MSGAANNKASPEEKKKKGIIAVVAVLVVVVIALVGVIAFLLGRSGSNSGDSVSESTNTGREVASSVRTVLDESTAQNVMDQMREEVAEGMFECQMSMTWNFEDGSSESSDAYVANNPNNTHALYFDVNLKDTDELIYSSPVLPVGTTLSNIKLDKELPAGDYKARVTYNLLQDVENQEVISSARFVITIHVLN